MPANLAVRYIFTAASFTSSPLNSYLQPPTSSFPLSDFIRKTLPLLNPRLLEAVAPLVVDGVTGVKEGLHAQLILVQIDGTQL